MNKPYIFYPVMFLLFCLVLIEVFIVFDGYERVRVRLRSGRKVSRRNDSFNELEDEEDE